LIGLVLVTSAAFALTVVRADGARHHDAETQTMLSDSDVPLPVRAILQRACQDCHSDHTTWPWYAQIPPVSWQIHSDVEKGRAFMNFSKWNDYTKGERRGYETSIGAVVQEKRMPPPNYLWIHREARLSNSELAILRAWAFAKH
jgi:Haem-binding domain